jgi:hypothetical protein
LKSSTFSAFQAEK